MKTQNYNNLDFNKKSIMELSDSNLSQIKGGTFPTSEVCLDLAKKWAELTVDIIK